MRCRGEATCLRGSSPSKARLAAHPIARRKGSWHRQTGKSRRRRRRAGSSNKSAGPRVRLRRCGGGEAALRPAGVVERRGGEAWARAVDEASVAGVCIAGVAGKRKRQAMIGDRQAGKQASHDGQAGKQASRQAGVQAHKRTSGEARTRASRPGQARPGQARRADRTINERRAGAAESGQVASPDLPSAHGLASWDVEGTTRSRLPPTRYSGY